MNAKNFERFLIDQYKKFGYTLSFEIKPIYKGTQTLIRTEQTLIGIYTEYSREIGGSKCYEGYIINDIHFGNRSYFCLILISEKREDYNLGIPFP